MSLYIYIFNIRPFFVGFMVHRLVLGQVFIRMLLFFPCPHHATNAPFSFASKCCS